MMAFVSRWCRRQARRRRLLSEARFKGQLADLRAQRYLAPYRAKAEIEWDLRFAHPLDKTWRDELMVVVLSLPIICWFLPPTHEYTKEAVQWLATLDPDAPLYFIGAWLLMLVATFGFKQLGSAMLPGRIGKLITAMASAKDDVPQEAVEQFVETPKGAGGLRAPQE